MELWQSLRVGFARMYAAAYILATAAYTLATRQYTSLPPPAPTAEELPQVSGTESTLNREGRELPPAPVRQSARDRADRQEAARSRAREASSTREYQETSASVEVQPAPIRSDQAPRNLTRERSAEIQPADDYSVPSAPHPNIEEPDIAEAQALSLLQVTMKEKMDAYAIEGDAVKTRQKQWLTSFALQNPRYFDVIADYVQENQKKELINMLHEMEPQIDIESLSTGDPTVSREDMLDYLRTRDNGPPSGPPSGPPQWVFLVLVAGVSSMVTYTFREYMDEKKRVTEEKRVNEASDE